MREDCLGRRSVAALVDLAMCIGLFLLLFRLFSRVIYRGDMTLRMVSGWPALFFPLAWIFYYPYTESCLQGTLGKVVCGLKVVANNGRDLTFGRMLLRRLLDPLEVWFAFGLVGWIIIAASPDGRRLGDKLAATRVVLSKAIPEDGPAGGLDNSDVSETRHLWDEASQVPSVWIAGH